METKLNPIDPLSEMLAVSTCGNKKNIILSILYLTGPMDKETMTESFLRAKKEFPEVDSCLMERKEKHRYYLYRDWRSGLSARLSFLDFEPQEGETIIDTCLRTLKHRLDRDWDLFNEPLGEAHVGRVSDELHILVTIVHHSAADAATAANFGFDIIRKYGEIVGEGNANLWSDKGSISTSRKRLTKEKKRTIKDTVIEAKDAVAPFFHSSQLPVGSRSSKSLDQLHIKRLLNKEITEEIMSDKRVPLVDKLVCASNTTIDQWNIKRNIKPGVLRTSVTVNMKGRYSWFDKPNNSGLIIFETKPEDRTDPGAFSKIIARSRINQFRNQMDLRFFINVDKMNNTFRIFPYKVRRRIVHFMMERHQYSIGVTMLGLLNPELRDGRHTGKSIKGACGDLVLNEITGTGYKLLSNTHLLIIAYLYGDFLNVILVCSASHFTRQEAEEFLDMVVRNIHPD
jgi:hypothetical protein